MKRIIINNLEERNIVCSIYDDIEGDIIYSGHKMAINEKVLPHVLQYYFDKFNSRFLFLNYMSWKKLYNLEPFQPTMTNCLFTEPNSSSGFRKSYESLLELMNKEFGKFQKITIAQINDN